MLRRLARVSAARLDRRLASVADTLDLADSEGWREALAARLVKRAKRLTAAIDEAGQVYAPESLHQVRIATKKLRYGLEIVVETGVRAASRPLAVVKRAQELLGEMHDLQVVQVHVAAVQAVTGGSRGLEALSRHVENRCRHLHGRYVASGPRPAEGGRRGAHGDRAAARPRAARAAAENEDGMAARPRGARRREGR